MKWGTIETELLVLPHASAAKNFCFWLHLFVSLVFSWLSNFENGSSASCIFRINTFYFAPNGVHYGCILLWYSSVQLDYLRIGRRRWRWNHSRDSFFFFKSLVWVWVGRVWMCLVKLCISAQFFLTHQLVARMIYYCELVGIEDGAVVHRCSAALTTPAKFDDKYSCVSHLDDWVQWAHIVQCHCSIWFRQMVIRYLHC